MKTLIAWLGTAVAVLAQDGWVITPEDTPFRLDFRPSLETVVWASDRPAPAFFESDDSAFIAPRLLLDVDGSVGESWFGHMSVSVDRGFDPIGDEDGEIRLDEIFLRWQAFEDQRLNLQIGRFATVFGASQAGHDFFDNPFMLSPLPYSQIIGINTRNPAAVSAAAIAARAAGTAPPVASLEKGNWASAVWGPVYATGASVSGSTAHFDYAAEVKNSMLSSHPDSWRGNGFGDPSWALRLGYRPDAAWAFGVSGSRGPWLEDSVPGIDRGDFQQTTLGLDGRWAHGRMLVTGEVILSEFETPDAGDLRTASWFVGGRYKVSPGVWLATRFGQTFANDAKSPAGADVPWQADVWRAEIAAGWQVTPSLLLKAGYAFTHTDDGGDSGEQLAGVGVGWQF
jgi:hypothetical protein